MNKYFNSNYTVYLVVAAGQCCSEFLVTPVNVAAYVGNSVSFPCTYNSTDPNDYLSFEAWSDALSDWDRVFRERQDVRPPYNATYSLSTNNSTTNEFVIDINSTNATHAVRHSCFMFTTKRREVVFVNLLGERLYTKPNMAIKSNYK
jgi:hypothetical protein